LNLLVERDTEKQPLAPKMTEGCIGLGSPDGLLLGPKTPGLASMVKKNLIWWVEREQKFWLPFGTAKLTKSLKFTTEII